MNIQSNNHPYDMYEYVCNVYVLYPCAPQPDSHLLHCEDFFVLEDFHLRLKLGANKQLHIV